MVEHYEGQGMPLHNLYPRLVDLLKNVWRCRRVAVDADGMGEGVASVLTKALGPSAETSLRFSAQSKSWLGYYLLSEVNSGRLKMYARDVSEEWAEFWRQVTSVRVQYRMDKTINFYMEKSQGHDDYLNSLPSWWKPESTFPESPKAASGNANWQWCKASTPLPTEL